MVWKKTHEFVVAVYRFTESFTDREKYGLAHQMRPAAVSSLAEGLGDRSQAEKARFPNIAEGSLQESRYYLIPAQNLGCGQTRSLTEMLEEVTRLLTRAREPFWPLVPDLWLPYPEGISSREPLPSKKMGEALAKIHLLACTDGP